MGIETEEKHRKDKVQKCNNYFKIKEEFEKKETGINQRKKQKKMSYS